MTWRAGTGHLHELRKAVPLDRLVECLQSVPGTLAILQRNPAPEEVMVLKGVRKGAAVDLSDWNDDLETMLAALDIIHEYVTVSNTNVHS